MQNKSFLHSDNGLQFDNLTLYRKPCLEVSNVNRPWLSGEMLSRVNSTSVGINLKVITICAIAWCEQVEGCLKIILLFALSRAQGRALLIFHEISVHGLFSKAFKHFEDFFVRKSALNYWRSKGSFELFVSNESSSRKSFNVIFVSKLE